MKREIIAGSVLFVLTGSSAFSQEHTEKSSDTSAQVIDQRAVDKGPVLLSPDKQYPATVDALLDNDLLPSEQPVVRELPWYLAVVKRPASFMLITCCDWWDRVYKRARRMIGLQPPVTDK